MSDEVSISKPKTKNPILIKEGKTITTADAFRKELRSSLSKYPIHFKRGFSMIDLFNQSLKKQKKFGMVFAKRFAEMQGDPYHPGYYRCTWTHAKSYSLLANLFVHHPSFIEPFSNAIRQYYYDPLLKVWSQTQSISYFPKTSDYCARALPGTRSDAHKKADMVAEKLQAHAEAHVPRKIYGEIQENYAKYFGN